LRATIDALQLSLEISFWRTKAGDEVDFVLYGKDGFFAFEVKRSNRLRGADFDGLNAFGEEYPESKRFLLHGGSASRAEHDVHVVPVAEALARLPELLGRRAQSTAIEPR
jgi:hypothetical protein